MTRQPRVDTELVRRGLARSREHASRLVTDGRVRAGGRTVAKPALRVQADVDLAVDAGADPEYASRAGHKLAGALAALARGEAPYAEPLRVRGRRCLDVGSSTGGFTDVLLRAGAAQVVCLDVGRDQLVPWLRGDPRTVVLEGRNIRDVTVHDLGGPVDLAVADVSFISLVLVLPALVDLAAPEADLLVMVKPQFEVGRHRVGSGGVVRDPGLRREAVLGVARAAADLGWGVQSTAPSPLPGPSGNREFFLWLARGPAAVTIGGEKVSW